MSIRERILARADLAPLVAARDLDGLAAAPPNITGVFAPTLQGASMFANGYLGNVAPANPVRAYRWRILRRHFSNPGT